MAKRVVDDATGVIYESIREAAAAAGMTTAALYGQLGPNKNRTTLRKLE
jgi:hypothetical protein